MKTPKENIPEEPPKEAIYRNEKAKKRVEGIEFTPILDAKQTVEIVERPKPRLEEIEKIEKINDLLHRQQ